MREKHIASKAVKNFPEMFRGTEKANLQKASRWWKARDAFLLLFKNGEGPLEKKSLSVNQDGPGRKRVQMKAVTGRGPKRQAWVEWLHMKLLEEFRRLKAARVKFSPKLLLAMARGILQSSVHPDFKATAMCPRDKNLIMDKLTHRWILTFQERFNIRICFQTGKLATSPAHEADMRKTVAFLLGQIQRDFVPGALDENMVENMDETHFIVNMDDGKTLGFRGDEECKYMDTVSGGEGMTMVLRITGGPNAAIQPPMMIFQNDARSYPIRGVPDDVPGVSYRSGPKGWNDKVVFPQWLGERRAIRRDFLNRKRYLFLDNCGCHNRSDELDAALAAINTDLRFLAPNSTHLAQPLDSFIIAAIKKHWSAAWEAKKLDMIKNNQVSLQSGKLLNPGKHFFLNLAAESVREVNKMRDKNGLMYARKAMIRCGLSLNLNGIWEISQLFPHLQEIIKENLDYFNGLPVPPVL
jgi:DDE superfamily endonuclease